MRRVGVAGLIRALFPVLSGGRGENKNFNAPACNRRPATRVLLLSLVVALGIPTRLLAQESLAYHSCTINAGGGWAPAVGTDSDSLKRAGWNFSAGGGFALSSRPRSGRRWSWFINVNFMFDRLGVQNRALQAAQISNPTNIGLLQATDAEAKFYSATLDPTFRFPITRRSDRVGMYVYGGFGWLRRSIEFTGVPAEGALLQPGGPKVLGNTGDSGAYDAGAGLNFRVYKNKGLMLYTEARVIHGLAVNSATTLVPISAGVRW